MHRLARYACSTVSLFLLFQIRILYKILLLLHCWLEHACNEKIHFAFLKSTTGNVRTYGTFFCLFPLMLSSLFIYYKSFSISLVIETNCYLDPLEFDLDVLYFHLASAITHDKDKLFFPSRLLKWAFEIQKYWHKCLECYEQQIIVTAINPDWTSIWPVTVGHTLSAFFNVEMFSKLVIWPSTSHFISHILSPRAWLTWNSII